MGIGIKKIKFMDYSMKFQVTKKTIKTKNEWRQEIERRFNDCDWIEGVDIRVGPVMAGGDHSFFVVVMGNQRDLEKHVEKKYYLERGSLREED